MKKIILFLTISLSIFLIILGSIKAPGYFLERKYSTYESDITSVPFEYYNASSTALSQKISGLLTIMDKINIISGVWEYSRTVTTPDKSRITEATAVSMARKEISRLHSENIYPLDLDNSYHNWYSWSTILYKYSDNTFNTYTSYLWYIKFKKYDSSVIQEILMTEEGVILQASITFNDDILADDYIETNCAQIDSLNEVKLKNCLLNKNIKNIDANTNIIVSRPNLIPNVYPQTTRKVLHSFYSANTILSNNYSNPTQFLFYQATTENQFVYGFMPYEIFSNNKE